MSKDLLNEYLEGSLPEAEKKKLREDLAGDSKLQLEFKLLSEVHNELEKMEEIRTSGDFTARLMERVARRYKEKKKEAFFIGAILSGFIFISFFIVLYVAYQVSGSLSVSDKIQDIIEPVGELFKNANLLVLRKYMTTVGAVLSVGILASAWFFFQSFRNTGSIKQSSIYRK
jgi:hypothetical protein